MTVARRGLAGALAVAALASGLSACSSPSPEEAKATFCADLAALDVQTAKLKAMVLQGSSTVEEVETQKAGVVTAYDAAKESGKDVAEQAVSDLEAAEKAFDDAIDAIPSDATVDQAKAAYSAALVQYTAAAASAKNQAAC